MTRPARKLPSVKKCCICGRRAHDLLHPDGPWRPKGEPGRAIRPPGKNVCAEHEPITPCHLAGADHVSDGRGACDRCGEPLPTAPPPPALVLGDAAALAHKARATVIHLADRRRERKAERASEKTRKTAPSRATDDQVRDALREVLATAARITELSAVELTVLVHLSRIGRRAPFDQVSTVIERAREDGIIELRHDEGQEEGWRWV